MMVCPTFTQAMLGLALAMAYTVPGNADPTPAPDPSPIASPIESPTASVETPIATPPATPTTSPDAAPSATASPEPSAAATTTAPPSIDSSVPSPAPSGSYKEDLKMAALATSLLLQAQSGDIDRSMLESKMNLALSPSMVQSVSAQLAPLGKPKSVTLVSRSVYGNYIAYKFRIVWESLAADESFALNPDGKIVAWQFAPAT